MSYVNLANITQTVIKSYSQSMQEKRDDLIALRSGIGTDKLDFAVVDDKTNIVNHIYVGYADTSKNPTPTEIGFPEHYTVGIGSTYRRDHGDVPNKCRVKHGWKYTESSGFFNPLHYTEEWIKERIKCVIKSRNLRLAESDWTQLADAPLSSSKKTEWATYRQVLRDLPANNIDFQNFVWPTKPS
tara:strand:- start:708 stop:1262 length:555 start_codon:yes stop_codon:yes gene_type:complete